MDKLFMGADILLPKKDFEKWAVVACDQYTSEKAYWEKTKEIVGDAPSALNIILPEIYLEDEPEKRIESINANMLKYTQQDVFEEKKDAMIYVERTVDGKTRYGVVGLIDLDNYEYTKGSKALIRATEQTVLERIPPRVQIRKDAILEMPHVLLLVDDPDFNVIAPLEGKKADFEKAYDFELMQNGGHICGYLLPKEQQTQLQSALQQIIDNSEDKLLFAVGDGNHSLATAKECSKLNGTELSKYALVEIVNIHDSSIEFEPIYRVLFGVDADDFMQKFIDFAGESDSDDAQAFECVTKNGSTNVKVNAKAKLPVGTLQTFIDSYLKDNSNVKVDYIHGEEVVYDLCKQENTLGFIFKGMQKNELFDAIKADGSLPRKTFSMGHAYDKRFYIECRKIK